MEIMKLRILLLSCIILLSPTFAVRADSSNVELVGREPFGPARAVYTDGDYAYLCAGGTLVILDVNDPAKPEEVGRINTPGIASGVYCVRSLLVNRGWGQDARALATRHSLW
jgi:hypothetical protein